MRFHMIFAALLLLFTVFIPMNSSAQTGRAYSLEECIQMALKFSPQIREQKVEAEIAGTRLEEAEGYQYPQIELVTLFGPAPNARGNQISSDYRNDRIEGLGVFGSADVKLVQPIYSFGKLEAAKKAARHGIAVEESRALQKSSDVALEITQYYYGQLAALEGSKLIDEIQGYLDKTIDRTKKLLEAESENASELDLNKLEAYQGLIARYREETEKNIVLSKKALRTFTGIPADKEFTVKDSSLEPVEADIKDIDYYSAASRELRPEFTQLSEGLKAKDSLINMTKADYYPTFFAAAFYSYSEASGRDRVTNPWIYDFFRHSGGGVALGLKWNLDFGITDSHVHRAKADYLKLERLRDYADIGIPMQVEKAYRELLEAKNSIAATRKAYQAARKWMIGAVMNYDMGIGEARDAADAIAAYGKIKEEYIKSVYNFNLGYANVIQTSGLAAKDISNKTGEIK